MELERFLSDIAHDLRNLLEGIDVTLFRDPSGASNPEIQDMVRREIYDLVRKTESFLDQARLRDSRIEPEVVAVALTPACQQALEKLGAFLRQRRLTFDPGEGDSFVSAHAGSIDKIVGSLLHAASRLTASGDAIRMSLDTRGVKTRLRVDFPTRSISDGRLERLFSLEDETGLGLGVSRALARLQGGDLWWERDEEGNRSLRLVLSMPSEAAPRLDEPSDSRKDELSILVVDDNADAAKSLAMLLSIAGHDTEVRHDGRSALEAVRSLSPDVVLLDLGLPDIDGYEVCRTLRRSRDASTMTLVAVSGRGDDEARRLSLEAGF
ncbi:MAG: hybrid sensor histidine kinase/response regulator, partial [Vicinamibacteria bacterium]